MNQQKSGEFLKSLRKSRGMTQEQLAEHFRVSSRAISRWETGRNMPDVGMLIELADFYEVDIRELIDGERKSENVDHNTKDTLMKMATYVKEKEKKTQSKVVYVALGICVTVLICVSLFAGGTKGILYGIVPENICDNILMCVYGCTAALLISCLRAYLWQEKPSKQPEKTVMAAVVSKEVKPGTNGAGRSNGGYSYVIDFITDDGRHLQLYAYEIEFGGLKEGTRGLLTFQGDYFVSFIENN